MVSKPRIISRSGKDVTGTSAASSERRSSNSSSSRDTSTSPAARKGYSSSKKKEDKKKDTSVSPAARKGYSSSKKKEDKKKDTSVSPAARKGTSSSKKKDSGRIKSTAERQAEARREAGGGKDYSDIPEGTAVTREKQAEAVNESYEKGSKQYEQEKQKYTEEVTAYAQQYGLKNLTAEQREYVDYGKLITAQQRPDTSISPMARRGARRPQVPQQPRRPGPALISAYQKKPFNISERERRRQQLEARGAMRLPDEGPRSTRTQGPALTSGRSPISMEGTAQQYEKRVNEMLLPLTSNRGIGGVVGGLTESVAYAPTSIPRLAVGLKRSPKAVAQESAMGFGDTITQNPARGAGQLLGMIAGPKIIKGITKAPAKVPYRVTRTGTEPSILLKTEMPAGSAAEAPKAPTQYTIPTLESAPKGIVAPGRGSIRGRVSEPAPKQPGIFTGRETQPGMVETFIKTTPEQLQQLQRRGITFQDKGFGKSVKTDYGSFRVVEPFGKGKPGKAGPIQQRVTGPEPKGRDFPFRIERKQELTPAELEIQTGSTIPGNIFETRAGRPKPQIELTGKRQVGFWESEAGSLRPTRTKVNEPSIYGELFQEPITSRARPQVALKTRQQSQSPMLGDLQSILDQSRARVKPKPKTQATARTAPKGKRGMLPGILPTFRTGVGAQPKQVPTIRPVPQFNIRTRDKPSPRIAPTTQPAPAPAISPNPTTTGTTPRSTFSPVIPRPTATKPPRVLPKRKKAGKKKKSGKKAGFEFYDVENPLAGFDKVFNMGNKR